MSSSGRGQALIPWPNRLQDGSYEFGGRHHQLPLNEPEHRNAIHIASKLRVMDVGRSKSRLPDRSAAQRRPLSQGSNPCGYPHKPLVSYRINRQLSGWIPPPLMIRAFGAYCHEPTYAVQ